MSDQVLPVLPLWQCRYGTVAESRLGSHTRVGLLPRSPCGPRPGAPRKTGRILESGDTQWAVCTPESSGVGSKGADQPRRVLGEGTEKAPLDQLVTSGAVRPENRDLKVGLGGISRAPHTINR